MAYFNVPAHQDIHEVGHCVSHKISPPLWYHQLCSNLKPTSIFSGLYIYIYIFAYFTINTIVCHYISLGIYIYITIYHISHYVPYFSCLIISSPTFLQRRSVARSIHQAPFEGVLGLALPALAEGGNFSFFDELANWQQGSDGGWGAKEPWGGHCVYMFIMRYNDYMCMYNIYIAYVYIYTLHCVHCIYIYTYCVLCAIYWYI